MGFILIFTYPATLVPDPVNDMFPEIVQSPADYCSDDIWNSGHQGLKVFLQMLMNFYFLCHIYQDIDRVNVSCTNQLLFTYLDDKSTGKVKKCNNSAPAELPIWEDLDGNSHENVFCWTEARVFNHPSEKGVFSN